MRAEFDKNKNVDPETAVRLVSEGERECFMQRSELLLQCKFLKYHWNDSLVSQGQNLNRL